MRVLDAGGADLNGSYRPLFGFAECAYTSVDLDPDPSVDVAIDGSVALPFADGSFDVVISGQTFEHAGPFCRLFAEMVRVWGDHGVIVEIGGAQSRSS